jgi:hypothetical protein
LITRARVHRDMERHACIFCGDTRMVVYKQISKVDVIDIVDRQINAGIRDPAIVFLWNFTRCLRARTEDANESFSASNTDTGFKTLSREEDCSADEESHTVAFDTTTYANPESGTRSSADNTLMADADMDTFSQVSVDHLSDDCDAEVEEVPIQCCICCFHWVTRRRKLPITVLPMQCLLYFILGINTVESKQCDTRVLTRLTATIGEEKNNVWRSIFQARELEAIDSIAVKKKTCVRKDEPCCVKRELALFYHAQNGNGMLVASRSVADILRAPLAETL